MGRYNVPLEEQETIIQFNRTDKSATVYTSDSTMMTKLDKLCESAPEYYTLEKQETIDGDVASKFYKLSDKKMISLRSKKVERVMTEEQKKIAAERMRNIRNISTTQTQETEQTD